ncbi:hypothetical protein M1615_00255 [Patescibacteria group bacterium]|nr:hypothetical protein [Patescibacteria group bacterium]
MQFPNKFTSLETFCEYLIETLLKSKSLTLPQIKEIFLKALKDYFEGNISLGFLQDIACTLYYELKPIYEIDIDRELGKALSEATEIEYYQEKEPEKYKTALEILKDYFQKNISFIS